MSVLRLKTFLILLVLAIVIGATNVFAPGDYICQYTATSSGVGYFDKTNSFTADSNKTVVVPMSSSAGLTAEEHNWLEFLYTCFNSGECIDLLRTINQTTKDIWKRVTGTDTSVVTFENITTNTLSATSNISIDYTIDIPIKEGYATGSLLPLRMFFWITDVNKTKCFNQDKATDTNRAEAPYCLPLVAETLGPNGGQVNFTVDLRPNIPINNAIHDYSNGYCYNVIFDYYSLVSVYNTYKKKRRIGKKIYLIFFLIIFLSPKLVSANLAENASWLDKNLTNSDYGTHSTILVGDIDNDGDKDFILSGCTDSNCQNPELTNVYLNNRTSLIINSTWSQNLTAMGSGGGALVDIDNDGDLDLLFTGSAIDFILYVNNGQTFTQNSTWEAEVLSNGAGSSNMLLGDVDNDGDLDLVMDGSTSSQTVFLNNGSVFVNNATWGSAIGSASFNRNHMFDYDNDGDLDFILSGFSGGASYFNNGTNFTEDPDGPIGGGERISNTMGDIDNDGDIDYLQIREDNSCGRDVKVNKDGIFNSNSTWENFAGGLSGSMALGGFTNNGYLDLVVARSCGADASNKVFVNNGTTFNDNQTLQGALRLAQVWVDINDDGKLDLFSTSIIYLNNISTTNTIPSPPTILNTTFDRDKDLINISWNAGSDTETPVAGLYYNLRIGTTSGGHDIVTGVYGSASSHDSGGSRVTGFFGNMMQRKAIKLKNTRFREGTTYYWSVQTIDTGLANGSWSGEYLFNTTADWTEP